MSKRKTVIDFLSTQRGALVGSLAFVILGIFLIFQPNLQSKIIGWVCILFFSMGAGILFWRIAFMRKTPRKSLYASDPHEIRVERRQPRDTEISEVWERVGDGINMSLQQVVATRNRAPEFSWSVTVSAGEIFRHGDGSVKFDEEIYRSLSQVPGVRTVGREDNESWVVDGDCDGEALVIAASLANDRVEREFEQE